MKKSIFFVLTLFATLFICYSAMASEPYNVVVGSSSNTAVGETAVQISGSTGTYTKAVIWEDSGVYDLNLYMGDTSDTVFTILHGNRETLDHFPADQPNGYYVSTTFTSAAGIKVNFISTIKK